MANEIKLYDFARRQKPNTCWSYNVWKIRMAMNYKSIPYKTMWVNHDTLAPTMKSLGLPPNTEGFEYTLPTIVAPDGAVVTDSATIAPLLERLYPTPSLHLNEALEAEAYSVIGKIVTTLFVVFVPRVARDVVEESTIPTFAATRKKRFGLDIGEMEAKGGESGWQAAEPGFAAMKALLSEHKRDDGPFILGKTVCYADFILIAAFESLKQDGEDMFERFVGFDESFAKLYEAAKPFLAKNE